ncbi:unnamed protein product, partial [Laminaria digitata]
MVRFSPLPCACSWRSSHSFMMPGSNFIETRSWGRGGLIAMSCQLFFIDGHFLSYSYNREVHEYQTPHFNGAPKPAVHLDVYHAKQRLISVAKKTHGAFLPFCRSLGDAFTIADPRALAELKEAVATLYPMFEPRDVDRYLSQNYNTTIQRHVMKIVPPPLTATERFDDVVSVFRHLRDAATDEPFFTPRLEKAANNLRPHLLQGCLSDPDPQFLSLYYCTGRSAKYGLPTFRSARGTNRVEAYHTPLRSLLGGHCSSPQLASSVLIVHNHRRNHRMAVKHRGLPESMNNFYHFFIIEDIQVEAASMSLELVYPFWES